MKRYIKSSYADSESSTNEITMTSSELVRFLSIINELKDSDISVVDEKPGHFKISINEAVYSLDTQNAQEYVS